MRNDVLILFVQRWGLPLSGASPSSAPEPAQARGSAEPPVHAPPTTLGQALRDAVQPLRDFTKVPPALTWAVNVPSFFEGLVYFGTLTVMTKFLSENIALGDISAGRLVSVFAGGVTGAMFLLGGLSDRWGVRRALLFSVLFLLVGRIIMALGETLHLVPGHYGSLHLTTMLGMLFIIIGYGAFQPSLYSAAKQYTNEKTAAMGYALIYGLQNLGAFTSGLLSPPVREASQPLIPPNGITGVLWTYTGLTLLCGLAVALGTRRRTGAGPEAVAVAKSLGAVRKEVAPGAALPLLGRVRRWLAEHPLADPRFSFFITVVVPVQTLFAHAWLTMPQYIERAYRDTPWVSRKFELFANLNPLFIFLLTPIVAALTPRANVYRMMIIGTAVMGLPTFLLVLGPHPASLVLFMVVTSFGEALWQPRFLQYIAELAPPGKTGLYMGIGQFPWFLTKVFTGWYSGWFLARYCPATGPQNTEFMWLVYALIAIVSPIGLILGQRWATSTGHSKKGTEAAVPASEK
jgi:POT family proton-dependent oligopeptide transporter